MADGDPAASMPARQDPAPIVGAGFVLMLLFLIGVANYLDRMLLAAVMPLIKAEFRLSDTQLGLLTGSAFSFVYALAGIPLGRLSDSRSRRAIIAGATAAWSLMTAACGLAGSYFSLLAARMGVAIGEAGALPASYSMVSDLYPPARRNWALGILVPSTAVGTIAGFSLGALVGAAYGWRMTFILLGLPGLLLALAAITLIREPRRSAMDQAAAKPVATGEAFRLLLANPMFLWTSLAAGFNGYLSAGIVQWLPSFFMRSHHVPLSTIGWIFGIAFGAGLGVGQFVGGLVAERMARRDLMSPLKLCAWASLATLPFYVGVLWVPRFELAMAMMFVATFTTGLCHAPQSAAVQNAVAANLRGTAHAIYAFVLVLVSAAIGPLVVGMLSDAFAATAGAGSLRIALTLSLAFLLLAAFSAWRAVRAGRGSR